LTKQIAQHGKVLGYLWWSWRESHPRPVCDSHTVYKLSSLTCFEKDDGRTSEPIPEPFLQSGNLPCCGRRTHHGQPTKVWHPTKLQLA